MKCVYLLVIGGLLLLPAEVSAEAAEWSMIDLTDEFGEVTSQGAVSEIAKPKRPLKPPYSDVRARIMIDCDRAWIRFSTTPLITGRSALRVAVRLDGKHVGYWPVRHTIGDKDIRFAFSGFVIGELSAASAIDVAVPWHREGSTVFSWSLSGASAAIKNSCD